jgi:hypothetical protein
MPQNQPEFTPTEQRVMYQIYKTMFNGLRSWINQIDNVSEEASFTADSGVDFTYAKQNLFAAHEIWKIFGSSEFETPPKKEWLRKNFPLLFGSDGGINGFVLSDSAFQTENRRGVKYRKRNTLSDTKVTQYFDELRRFLKLLDTKNIDDLIS